MVPGYPCCCADAASLVACGLMATLVGGQRVRAQRSVHAECGGRLLRREVAVNRQALAIVIVFYQAIRMRDGDKNGDHAGDDSGRG